MNYRFMEVPVLAPAEGNKLCLHVITINCATIQYLSDAKPIEEIDAIIGGVCAVRFLSGDNQVIAVPRTHLSRAMMDEKMQVNIVALVKIMEPLCGAKLHSTDAEIMEFEFAESVLPYKS